MRIFGALVLLLILGSATGLWAKGRGLKDVLDDSLASEAWIYDDLAAGFKQAKKSGKPLLISFTCVP